MTKFRHNVTFIRWGINGCSVAGFFARAGACDAVAGIMLHFGTRRRVDAPLEKALWGESLEEGHAVLEYL